VIVVARAGDRRDVIERSRAVGSRIEEVYASRGVGGAPVLRLSGPLAL
jgi:hypothetical protein